MYKYAHENIYMHTNTHTLSPGVIALFLRIYMPLETISKYLALHAFNPDYTYGNTCMCIYTYKYIHIYVPAVDVVFPHT